jgi:hypothetical protein
MPQRSAVALALALLGCSHTDPFIPVDQGTGQPFDPTPPVRLTLNDAADRGATWLPDGSGIAYSTQLLSRFDQDLCLTALPPTGGRQREVWCDVPGDTTVTDAVESPAPSPDGRLLFLAATGQIGASNPGTEGIALAPTLDPTNAQIVRLLPFTPVGAPPQNGATQFRWLGPNRALYLGTEVRYRTFCVGCPLDTLVQGRSINLLQVGLDPTFVLGTENATSVSAAPDGDAFYYTLVGQSQVWRSSLSGGVPSVVVDFGQIARDVHLVGNRLVAVVGGRVAFNELIPLLGPVQWDSGGVIHVVDLVSGSDQPLDDPVRLYRRPVLSPAGDRIVAEGYSLIITPTEFGTDTTVSRASDLFLIGAP